MSGVIEFVWTALTLEHDTATGWTNTRYPDGHTSGCAPVPEDAFHAEALGIAPERHRLVHELLHHLVGFAFGYAGSPVIWRDANGFEQSLCVETGARMYVLMDTPLCLAAPHLTAEIEEWIVTAYTYALYGKPHDAGAMMDVERLCPPRAGEWIWAVARYALPAAERARLAQMNAKVRMPEPLAAESP